MPRCIYRVQPVEHHHSLHHVVPHAAVPVGSDGSVLATAQNILNKTKGRKITHVPSQLSVCIVIFHVPSVGMPCSRSQGPMASSNFWTARLPCRVMKMSGFRTPAALGVRKSRLYWPSLRYVACSSMPPMICLTQALVLSGSRSFQSPWPKTKAKGLSGFSWGIFSSISKTSESETGCSTILLSIVRGQSLLIMTIKGIVGSGDTHIERWPWRPVGNAWNRDRSHTPRHSRGR